MAGNVDEWCLDAYDEEFYAVSDNSRNPIAGGKTGQWLRENFTSIPDDLGRVSRGGSWGNDAQYVRVASRNWDSPTSTINHPGFRCVKDITP